MLNRSPINCVLVGEKKHAGFVTDARARFSVRGPSWHKSSVAIETPLVLAKDRGAPCYFVVNSVRIQG